MMTLKRYDGFASFDALLSLLPLTLMALLLLQSADCLKKQAEGAVRRQQVFDKVVSAADYTVRTGAVVRGNGIKYPNWIDRALLTTAYAESLRGREGLSALEIGFDRPEGGQAVCVQRLVVSGPEKELGSLFVCGG